MISIRFYTDEQMAKAVAIGLRQRQVDVMTVAEASMRGASDVDQLAYAHANGRVMVTQDTDFLRLAAEGAPHSGIVYAPQQTPFGAIVRVLMMLYLMRAREEMIDRIEYI